MSPREYGEHLALTAPPITDEQAEQAARIFYTAEQVAA